MSIDTQALRKLAVDAKELAIINRYTKGIEAQKKFIAEMTPDTVLALLDELEAKEEQRANWFQMAQKLGENLDSAEKRIAELNEFVQHVKKCLVKNDEYAPLSHEVIDTILGINAAGITVKGDGE